MAELKRTLSFPMLLIITINSIMGTGIFFLPAVGAREAGPASILSWLFMAALAMIISLIFSELVSMYPKSGGVYEYTKQAFGTFPSFIFGWMTLMAANITIAMLVVGGVRYLNPALPEAMKIAIGIVLVIIFNFMAYRGMKTSAVMLVTFGIVTIVTLLALIIPGIITFNVGNLTPFFTHPSSKILLTVFLIAETFFGWETATFLAEETKNPEKNMPRALWIGTLVIAVLSLVFVIVSMANVPWTTFGLTKTPLSYLGSLYFGSSATPFISILVYLSIIGSVAGWIVASPRLVMSLAKDKLFIQQFADVHEEYRTPHKAILFQTILTSALIVVGSGNYETLLELLVPLVLLMYTGVMLSFIILRYKKKEEPRPFKVWLGVPFAVLVIGCIFALLISWIVFAHGALQILKLGVSFVAAGIPIYLLLTYFYNPDVLIRTTNKLAVLNLWFENIFLPKSLRREILALFPDAERKHILELGAGVGTMTMHLAEHVGTEGKITALDLSKHNITILERRMQKMGHKHVNVIHDPHMINRIHPSVESADMMLSVGNLSYIQDLQKVLRDLGDILPPRGRICFVEYVDVFWFLPNNPKWVKDPDMIQKLFKDTAFSVSMKIHKGLFWNYLYIYGVKENRDVPYV